MLITALYITVQKYKGEFSMKFGAIWFLHLDFLIKISRWAAAAFFVLGLTVPILGSLFVISWVLFGIFFAIALSTFFIHFPSNEKILKIISDQERDFEEQQKNEFRNYQKVKITTLQCFSIDKKTSLCRWIGKKKIYSELVILAWVETKDELWLIRNEKSLRHDRPAVITKYRIHSLEDVQSEKEAADSDGMANWHLQIGEESFAFCCKDDYHLRDFLNYKRLST